MTITKKIMLLTTLCLFQAQCHAMADRDARFFRKLSVVAVVSAGVGYLCKQMTWSTLSQQSNEEFRAKVEANAEGNQTHYASQSHKQDEKAESLSLAHLKNSSALAKEVSRVKSDANMTRIRLREAHRESYKNCFLGTFGTAICGTYWAALTTH